jgi:hypothetical protein
MGAVMRRFPAGVLLIGLLLVVSGCTPQETKPTLAPMWQAQFDSALADPKLSDFQREVLSDYQVTDAEDQEAWDRFSQCMLDQGWDVEVSGDGSFSVGGVPGTENANDPNGVPYDVTDGCQSGTIVHVDEIYRGLRDNPEGKTRYQLIRDCFDAHGVPDGKGLTDDAFAKLIDDPQFKASTVEGKICYSDPDGSLGVTAEDAQRMEDERLGASQAPDLEVTCVDRPDGSRACEAKNPDYNPSPSS